MYKFKIGDRIIVKENSSYSGIIGTIIKRSNDRGMRYEIYLDEKNEIFTYYIFPESLLELLDVELLKERNRLKEEMRLIHMEIDPFGEENW